MTQAPTLTDLLRQHADALARARALTEAMSTAPEERRELIRQLAAEGIPMAALARVLGISRQRLYAIVGNQTSSASPA